MPHPLFRRLGAVSRAGLLCLVMLALLLQTYALYLASALVPYQPWRRRLNFHLRRVMFAMDSMHVRGQEYDLTAHRVSSGAAGHAAVRYEHAPPSV